MMKSVDSCSRINMDVRAWSLLLFIIIPEAIGFEKSSDEDRRLDYRRGVHYHTKRHMALTSNELKRRPTTLKPRELRKKPSGHLKALKEDDMENDEVVSVAVGPPPLRLNYEKIQRKQAARPSNNTTPNESATNLVKDVLVQLGREFLTRQVSEDFVFGQYVGNAMKNLTSSMRLKMQHEILDVILKYQRAKEDIKMEDIKLEKQLLPTLKELKSERRLPTNDTDENWPDFTNLAKIVG